MHHTGSYLLLVGKRKLQNFEISHDYFLLLWNKCLPFFTPPSNKPCLNKRQGHLLKEIRYASKENKINYFFTMAYHLDVIVRGLLFCITPSTTLYENTLNYLEFIAIQ